MNHSDKRVIVFIETFKSIIEIMESTIALMRNKSSEIVQPPYFVLHN
jgi:hypothetical protein